MEGNQEIDTINSEHYLLIKSRMLQEMKQETKQEGEPLWSSGQ